MKLSIWLFILIQLADIVTTKIALTFPRVYEANMIMAGTIYWVEFKLFVVLIICLIMQRFNFGKKKEALILILASIPPLWNIGLMCYYKLFIG